MTVYKKLSEARVAFLGSPVKKSGKNKFAGYEYFELGDFIPTVLQIFDGHGLCGVCAAQICTCESTIIMIGLLSLYCVKQRVEAN